MSVGQILVILIIYGAKLEVSLNNTMRTSLLQKKHQN